MPTYSIVILCIEIPADVTANKLYFSSVRYIQSYNVKDFCDIVI